MVFGQVYDYLEKMMVFLRWKPDISFIKLIEMMVDADLRFVKEQHGL